MFCKSPWSVCLCLFFFNSIIVLVLDTLMLLLFTLLESLAPALTAAPSCSFCLWLTGCEVRCSQRLHHRVADLLLPPPGKVQTCCFFLLLFFLPDFADRKVLFAVTSDTNLLNKTATSAALFFHSMGLSAAVWMVYRLQFPAWTCYTTVNLFWKHLWIVQYNM